MLGKTHMVVGIAAALAVTQPANIQEMILAVGGGALGALISDIDVESSASHHEADKITLLSVFAVLAVVVLDKYFHAGIIERIVQSSGYKRIIGGAVLFVIICAFGKEQPHRSFMHSFLAMGALCFAIGLVWKEAVYCFAVGFLSHLATDILNKRKVQLLYPLPGGIALRLFHAHGMANTLLFIAGSIVAVAEIVMFAARFLEIR